MSSPPPTHSTSADDNLTLLEPHSETPYQDSYDGPEPSIASTSPLHLRSSATSARSSDDDNLVLPRWLRESSSKSSHLLSLQWLPLPVRQFGRFLNAWSKGPSPPRIQKISPWFPKVQEAPLRAVERFLPKRRYKVLALAALYAAWLLTFALVIRGQSQSGYIEGYGRPQSIWCGANLWGANNACSLSGSSCRPFSNSSLPFRCAADCASTRLHNPRAVGNSTYNFRPFVIGGPSPSSPAPVYRADSFICQAAIHAGVVSNLAGGCGVLKLVGEAAEFHASEKHGIRSVGFDSAFPKAYTFEDAAQGACGVVDQRWALLAVTVVFSSLLSLFVASPAVFFPGVFAMLFFHVGLVSDRPNIYAFNSLFELLLGRFLPAALGAYVVYRFSVRPCLEGLTAQVEKTVLWLGAAWVGALNNYTLGWIPIERLTPRDIKAQPGAVFALVVIVLVIFFVALGQVHYLQQEGRFRRYILLYLLFGAVLVFGVVLPGLNLRIHHYILALLLLPGTRTQTRACLLYQGLLVGLYINGTARWGFASILQTTAALVGDGQTDSLLPNITAVAGISNVTFTWPMLPSMYDGISMLVNDVERKRWYEGEGAREFVWKGGSGRKVGKNEYFRFAFMDGSRSADYTKAGTWEIDGGWGEMEPGSS